MKKAYFIHPLLFATYPIIFLYSHNVQEVLLKQLIVPISLSVIVTLLMFLLINIIIKNKYKSSLILTIFLMAFFTYGYVFDSFVALDLFNVKHRFLLPIFLYIAGYIAYFIYSAKSDITIENISKIITVVIATLILLNLINVIPYEINKLNLAEQNDEIKQSKINSSVSQQKPDIYYIILDEYASLSTIKDFWNYDNSNFAKTLESKDFFVAKNSKVKYFETVKAIPSYLNMQYVDEKNTTTTNYQLINDNKIIKFLKQKGYKTIAFDCWYTIVKAKGLINVDENYNFLINPNVTYLDGFSDLLLNSTALKPFLYLFKLKYTDVDNLQRNSTMFTFNMLKTMPNTKGPKFVYAHIVCPHTPFTFDQNGGEIDSLNRSNWKEKKYYLDQYVFITKQLEMLAISLLKNSKEPPIIIIQSDHGPRPQYGQNINQRFNISDSESRKVFNAYYLPGDGKNLLTDNISPINSFRLIFNEYLGGKFNILEAAN